MASWAQMMDVVWGVVDGYYPLTSWLAARGGRKIKFASEDRLRADLTKFDLPALMVWMGKADSHWRSNAQLATAMTFVVQMVSDGRSEEEALDFGWLVWQALAGQKATNFGLENLLTWTMEAGPLERVADERKAGGNAAAWKMRVAVTLVVVE